MLWLRMRHRFRRWFPYLLSACAFVWRRIMFRTKVIAITGSVGKTTATNALGSILSAHYPTNWTPGGRNGREALARVILRTRFRHRYTVIEIGTRAPGALRRAAWMIAPDVAVVLRVLNIHSNAFPTLEAMAEEKASLLHRLGARGTAILNADDPLVMAMAQRCRKVRTFGISSDAFVKASEISSKWPTRLSFRASCASESAWVETRLVGDHMVLPALAALAAAVHCGVPLQKAADCFANIEPVNGRLQPMLLPMGATVLRDDFNASLATLGPALEVLRTARATRRILVLGDVLDSGMSERPRTRYLAARAAESCDVAVFLGALARIAARAAVSAGMSQDSAFAFGTVLEASEFLRTALRPGDLVLVRGWMGHHIERVALAQLGSVGCWVERCSKVMACEDCPELNLVSISFGEKPHPVS